MESTIPTPGLNCTQCGGELHPDEDQIFLTCPYCGSTVYLDKSRVVFHWSLTPTLDEAKARGVLANWMASSKTVKDLDKKARLVGTAFEYFPMWYIKYQLEGKEVIALEPAAATSITELRRLNLPAGDLQKYDPRLDAQAHTPSVPMDTAVGWVQQNRGSAVQIKETALVHIPIFSFKYVYNNQTYTAVVEAATGATLANIYPAKSEAPYVLAGGITAGVYLCLALIPIAFAAGNSGTSTTLGLAICTGAGLVAAPFLFALALWVASKI
jgi:DNA-directed RNA polymerase subunit RPC12/RpoP